MRFEFCDARFFRDLLKALNTIDSEIFFKVDDDGLRVAQMDSAHIAFVALEMPVDVFDQFFCIEKEVLCVDVETLIKRVFKNVSKDERVEWETEKDQLNVRIHGDITRNFTIPLIESKYDEVPEPPIEVNAAFLTTPTVLRKILADVQSDTIVLEAGEDRVRFSSSGYDVTYFVELDRYSPQILELAIKDGSKAAYSVEYIESFVKALQPISDTVRIEFSTDMPMRMTGYLTYGVKLKYYLAPRVGEEI